MLYIDRSYARITAWTACLLGWSQRHFSGIQWRVKVLHEIFGMFSQRASEDLWSVSGLRQGASGDVSDSFQRHFEESRAGFRDVSGGSMRSHGCLGPLYGYSMGSQGLQGFLKESHGGTVYVSETLKGSHWVAGVLGGFRCMSWDSTQSVSHHIGFKGVPGDFRGLPEAFQREFAGTLQRPHNGFLYTIYEVSEGFREVSKVFRGRFSWVTWALWNAPETFLSVALAFS